MIVGSVFSGMDGVTASMRHSGLDDWRVAWHAETDARANAVLDRTSAGIVNRGDVTEIDANAVEPVDLLIGGSPCQSFSVAGNRLGLDDPRGDLALEYLRLARRLRPRWLAFENVPGFLSSGGGRDFGAFLGLLGQLGYHAAWRVLDARYFGVPQRRRRVVLVGYPGDWRPPAAVPFEPESLRGDPPPRREAGQGLAAPTATGVGSGGAAGVALRGRDGGGAAALTGPVSPALRCARGGGDRAHALTHAVAFGGNNTAGPVGVAAALNASKTRAGRQDFESETFVTHSLRAEGFDASEDGAGRGTPLLPVAFEKSMHGHNRPPNVMVRRLTPLECPRLQGFPDDWFDGVAHRGRPLSDSARYFLTGNAWAVPVFAWALARIDAWERRS